MTNKPERSLKAEVFSGLNGKISAFGFAVLTVIFIIVFFDLLTGKSVFTHDTIWFYGIFHYFAGSLQRGVLPLWNPYNYCGQPFYPDIAIMYILNPLTLAIIGINKILNASLLTVYHWHFLVKILFMNLGIYACLLHTSKSKWAALFGVMTFMFSSVTIASLRQAGFVYTLGYFPWVLFFLLRVIESKKVFDALGLGLFAGLSMTGYQGLSVIVLSFFFLSTLFVNNFRSVVYPLTSPRGLALALASLVVFGILSSPLAVLFFQKDDFIPLARMRTTPSGSISYTNASAGHPSEFQDFLCLVDRKMAASGYFTKKHNLSEGIMYIGLIPLALSILGLVKGKNTYKLNFLLIGILVFLLMIGKKFFFEDILKWLFPPFKYFRHMNLFMGYFLFFVVFFTAQGFDAALTLIKKKHLMLVFVAGAFALTFIDLITFGAELRRYVTREKPKYAFSEFWKEDTFPGRRRDHLVTPDYVRYYRPLLYQTHTALESLTTIKEFAEGPIKLIGLYDIYNGMEVTKSFVFSADIEKMNIHNFLDRSFNDYPGWTTADKIAFLHLLHFIALDFLKDISFYRSFDGLIDSALDVEEAVKQGFKDHLGGKAEWSAKSKAESAINAMIELDYPVEKSAPQKRYLLSWNNKWTTFESRMEYHKRIYSTESVSDYLKYLWGLNHSEEFTLLQFERFYHLDDLLRRSKSASPETRRAFRRMAGVDRDIVRFYPDAYIGTREKIAEEMLVNPEEDILFVEDEKSHPAGGMPGAESGKNFTYQVSNYKPNSFTVKFDAPRDGYLYVALGYDPFWQVHLDGKKVVTRAANIAFQAIPVSRGGHLARFVYRPKYYIAALTGYYLTIIFCLWYFLKEALSCRTRGKTKRALKGGRFCPPGDS